MIGMDGMILLYRSIRIGQITAVFKHKTASKSKSDLYFLVSISVERTIWILFSPTLTLESKKNPSQKQHLANTQ